AKPEFGCKRGMGRTELAGSRDAGAAEGARSSIPLVPLLAHHGVAAREREHDLRADAGRRLAAAVGEDDDAEALLRHHADIGRGVVEPTVLVDDLEAVVLDALPGERLGEARIDRKRALRAKAIASCSGALSGIA